MRTSDQLRCCPIRALLLAALALLLIGCASDTQETGSATCSNDQDCADQGTFCLDGVCRQCVTDLQCPEGHHCEEGACVHTRGFCSFNLPCPPPLRCRSNQCGPECLRDDECPADYTCRGNYCTANPTCATDVDCPFDMLCVQGVCRRNSGCQLAEVFFDFNEAAIRIDAMPVLERNAACARETLGQAPASTLSLLGHADERGTLRYNYFLSRDRAFAVARSMARHGISPRRMRIVPLGESAPAIPNASTEAEYQRNRRVQARIGQ